VKVLSLRCEAGHGFEGWFGSEDDYRDQHARGLVTCPLCGDVRVTKLPSAPRLNLHTTPQPSGDASPGQAQQAGWMRAWREVMARTRDVGAQFPEQALRMHHGDIPAQPIRGQATADEAVALLEEGVDLLPLPALPGLKDTLQ
jgi:hypothetical protein